MLSDNNIEIKQEIKIYSLFCKECNKTWISSEKYPLYCPYCGASGKTCKSCKYIDYFRDGSFYCTNHKTKCNEISLNDWESGERL